MKRNQFEFDVTIKIDRDMVPGFGYMAEDWFNRIFHDLLRNDHYHPSINIKEVRYVIPEREKISGEMLPEQVIVAMTVAELDELILQRSQQAAVDLMKVFGK